tara:strand:+ start:273 stop:2000 length:1728 start_codon:yes stop_codon:yes gene_type:complete
MQFQLPTNLQAELVAYDPQLKALARTQKQSTTKKSKYPLGNPVDLIPNDIISAIQLQKAIDDINQELAPSRYREFTKVTTEGTITHAVLYHYEQVWYAAWLPPADKKANYIYGYTYAYKDTDTTRKVLPHALRRATDDCVSKPSGRCTFLTYTQQITKRDVIDGKDTRNWNIPGVNAWAKKSRRLREPINRFEAQVQLSIPQWEDSRTMFERIKTTCIADLLTRSYNTDYWINKSKSEWLPSVENVFNFIKQDDITSAYNIIDNGCASYKSILHILDTPFFRKWIQNKCNESIESFNNPDNETKADIIQPWNTIFHLCKQIKTIHNIWGDKCPLDYYQTNLEALLCVTVDSGYRTKANWPWLVQHMPVASFFTWINKFYETKADEHLDNLHSMRYYMSSHTGLYVFPFRELEDTLSMVTTVLEDKGELAPPKRWRITEFHDYVQAEAWKISNVNERLPQDLFPAPVKVQHNNQQWAFIQPIDTHQLAAWGQAVRNCVGNATGYAEGVRKKQHFIVLCMIDNKPQFTVQLKVSMGMMTVDQIAGISNARLSEEQRESYTKVFGQALQQREEVLASA